MTAPEEFPPPGNAEPQLGQNASQAKILHFPHPAQPGFWR